jgi:hypothetical protein
MASTSSSVYLDHRIAVDVEVFLLATVLGVCSASNQNVCVELSFENNVAGAVM